MRYRPLGRTGFDASILGLGGESALYQLTDEAVEIVLRALELGVNYFDTAPLYQDSELVYGTILPHYREEMFIATKTDQRDYDGAWRQFERSLRRLRVDRVDLLQVHHLDNMDELEEVLSDRGALRMMIEAQEQGLVGFLGVTGHTDPDVLLAAIDSYPFDNILMALNAAEIHIQSFQTALLPRAVELQMGIVAMKVVARGLLLEKMGWGVDQALRYVLTLPVTTAIMGFMNIGQLDRAVEAVEGFRRLSDATMMQMEEMTAPFARDINLYRGDVDGQLPMPDTMIQEVR